MQDQFLKAGLVNKNKTKQLQQDQTKQQEIERRIGTQTVDEGKLTAAELQRKNAERAGELNAQRDAAAQQKAIMAQIVQMVQKNRQNEGNGDDACNFTRSSKIERMMCRSRCRPS